MTPDTQRGLETAIKVSKGVMPLNVLIPKAELADAKEWMKGKHHTKSLILIAKEEWKNDLFCSGV